MIAGLFGNPNYDMSKTVLDVATKRHEALATNIANVETPGYRRADVSVSFAKELQRRFANGEGVALHGTVPTEVDAGARSLRADGNNVELDAELLKMGNNQMDYEVATEFVNNSLQLLRTAITGRDLH